MSSNTEQYETIEGTPMLTDNEKNNKIFQNFNKQMNEIEEIKFIVKVIPLRGTKNRFYLKRIDIKFLNLEYTYSIFLNSVCSITKIKNNYYIPSECIIANISPKIRKTKLDAFNIGLMTNIFNNLKQYNRSWYVLNEYQDGDRFINATLEDIDDTEIHLTIPILVEGKVDLAWFAGGLRKKRKYKSKKNVKNLHKRRTRSRPRRA